MQYFNEFATLTLVCGHIQNFGCVAPIQWFDSIGY